MYNSMGKPEGQYIYISGKGDWMTSVTCAISKHPIHRNRQNKLEEWSLQAGEGEVEKCWLKAQMFSYKNTARVSRAM